jgi:hypothetical protein
VIVRPTPAEVISGVRRILRDVVEPEVGSEFARSRLREVRAVLAQVDWDDAALQVRRDRDTLRALNAESRAWMLADPARAAAFEGLASPITPSDGPEPEPFTDLNASYAAEAALLAEVSGALARWTGEHPDDIPARQLRRRLAAELSG